MESKAQFWIQSIVFVLMFDMIVEHGAVAYMCAAIIILARLIDHCLDELANGWIIRREIRIRQKKGREGGNGVFFKHRSWEGWR